MIRQRTGLLFVSLGCGSEMLEIGGPDLRQICAKFARRAQTRRRRVIHLSDVVAQFENASGISRIALDQKVEGSNPSSPAKSCFWPQRERDWPILNSNPRVRTSSNPVNFDQF